MRQGAAWPLVLVLVLVGCPDESDPGAQLDIVVFPDTTGGGGGDSVVMIDPGPTLDEGPGEDAGPIDAGSEPDAGEDPLPIPWQPCTENSDCDSGWCVETADGRTCTRTCIDSCPNGWFCGPVSNTGTDVTYICLPRFVTLCNPCQGDADCAGTQEPGANKCLLYGPGGSFCGAACAAGDGDDADQDEDCPDGYACDDGQCRRVAGECSCSWKAVKDAASTTCTKSSELGTCSGQRSCLTGELNACDAAEPVYEICDAQDNDCDGLIDEELPLDPCAETNDHGTCTGVKVCEAGVSACTAATPANELCDGGDNDCDDQTDEGFPDSDADGVADCVSDDDDGDGVPDAFDNCPKDANAEQTDSDGDGAGDACDGDSDGDGDPNDTDCAPSDPKIGALATEVCNGIDDDCDLLLDEAFADLDGDTLADCVDSDDDGDGVEDTADNCPVTANADQEDSDQDGTGDVCDMDTDGDKDPDVSDCAPLDFTIHHAASESCDGIDQNCNGIVDEGFPDTDGDGVADCLDTDDDGDGVPDVDDLCVLVSDAAQLDSDADGEGDACDIDDDDDGTPDVLDCSPLDPAVNPKVGETCNGKDDDCDGVTDETDATGCSVFLFDGDNDGFGVSGLEKCACSPEAPFTAQTGGDCNDQNGQVFPGATEICNAKDDDCDEEVDEGAAVGCQDAWPDGDGDGFGAGAGSCVCPGTPGFAAQKGDCDDSSAAANPLALEKCNGTDDNCDGLADEKGALGCQSFYLDVDEDGFGVFGEQLCLCGPAGQHIAPTGGDCNDNDGDVFPTNPEVCDAKDNNCNGQVDEGVKTTFFLDEDQDGFGASYSPLQACEAPAGHVAKAGDCNDFNDAIFPGAAEACNDIDDDCDGKIDDGLITQSLYKDNDGDGFAAPNASAQDKCDVPVGWTLAQDADGDGKSDWDCDDSDVTAFPLAPTVCGDGKDNDCDGLVDRLCFTGCGGQWPYQPTFVVGTPRPRAVDLNGDGNHETLVRHTFGTAILEADGTPLHDYSAPVHNFARGLPVFADIDDYDKHGPTVQTLEVLTGDGSHPRFYKVQAGGAVLEIGSPETVYDASKLMVTDIDHDGVVELVTSTWCEASGSEIYRYDRTTGEIVKVAGVADPDGVCQYTDGRTLTDLDGDGVVELVYGNGYANNTTINLWAGQIYVEKFTDLATLSTAPWCEGCFDTALEGLIGGGTGTLFRVGDEIRAGVVYFYTQLPNTNNQSTGRYWRFGLDGQPLADQPTTSSTLYLGVTDVDDDGTPESLAEAAWPGLFDVNGDGYPDRVHSGGGLLRVSLWDPAAKAFVHNAGSEVAVSAGNVSIGSLWDIDGDGRIEVLTGDDTGKVHCHRMGEGTWNRLSSLPPHHPLPYRTFQWDNYEPNDGADFDADGLPDAISRIPSALTASDAFYSYLSTPTDEDYLLVDTSWSGTVCVQAPPGRAYSLHVYSVFDRLNNETGEAGADGKPDGLIWENTGGANKKCWSAGYVAPHRNGEYRFIIGIKSLDGDFSPHWPYWVTAPK